MKLKTLRIKNFLGIAEASLSFERKGLTLVGGLNHDSPVSSSNGSGKSTLYEAIYFALYGKTKRGVTGDEVINRRAASNCRVEIEFDDYRAVRTRKDSVYGTTLRLFQKDGYEWNDITKGTVKDTQEILEKAVGMSDLTFNKVCYFGQGDLKPFASLSDGELKQVFEQALNLTFISDYHAAVKTELGAKERELDFLKKEMESLDRERNATVEKVKLLTAAIAELEHRSSREQQRIEAEIGLEKQELALLHDGLREARATYDLQALELRQRLEKLSQKKALKSELETKREPVLKELTRLNTLDELAQQQLESTLHEIENSFLKEGEPCGECGRPFSRQDVEFVRRALFTKAERIREEMRIRKDERQSMEEKLLEIAEASTNLDKEVHGLERAAGDLNLAARQAGIEGIQKLIDSADNRLSKLHNTLSELKSQAGTETYQGELSSCKIAIDLLTDQLGSRGAKQREVKEEIEALAMLEEIFGNTGMKSYIFDSITPELNRLINGFLSLLNPDVTVEVSTVTRLKGKKEQYRERFAINVTNLNGAKSYEGNSDGEKQLINLAIALAFNSLCRALTKSSVNFLWMDEPFESLDESSAERAVEICNDFSARIDNLFIISHNPAISELVTHRIVVEKRNGMATVH